DEEISNRMEDWAQLIHPDDVEKVNHALEDYFAGNSLFFDVEHRMIHKNGSIIWILARGQGQRDTQERIHRMIGSDTDITVRKEAELAEKEARKAQQERDRYLQSLTEIQQKLLTASDLNLALYQDILKLLGETAQTSRSYFFTAHRNKQGQWLISQQAEWCAQRITPQIDNPQLQNLPLAETMPLLMETLFAQEVYSHHVVNLPPRDRNALESQGIQSILVFPLFVNRELFGLIGFDQCDHQRKWSDLEMNFLRWATNSIAIAQEKQHSQNALLESEKKYRSIFENITQGIFQITIEGQYLSANPFLAHLYGYDSPDDLIASITNLPEQLYVDPQRRHKLAQLTLEYGTAKNFESQVYRKDGRKIWISVTQHAVYDSTGHFLYFEGVVEDITARKAAEDQLYYQAFHDGLTQLSNRTWFVQRLEGAIYAYENGFTENCYAVFFIDLDRFKIINDSLGHMTGDELLKQVGDRLAEITTDSDLIARFGGDEFALLATNITCQEDCCYIAQQLIDSFQDPFLLKGNRYFIGASIGIALGDLYYKTPEEVLRDADAAMYEAKAKGGGYVFFQPEIRERVLSCLLLENDLDGAIEREEFQLHYQPLVYLENNQLYGFEVLLRWIHPQRGAISPAHFIPIAEQTGVIKDLDAWVLKQSCRQLRQWQNEFSNAQDLVISVNLSPVELLQPNLVEQIAQTLKTEAIPPHCIRLELTETAFLDDTRLEVFQHLQTLGIQISIDDFGTGESSLSRLHQLPLNTIKVDRIFVQQLDQGHSGEALVQTILNLAHSLGVNTLSEGIESAQQRDILLNLGCLLGQGYFYSPPVSVNVATAMLAEGNISRFISETNSALS
ncbi:MAG: EAL domain-containing protein, partial [Halothece sp. Uz-M2-17]|nr:EAL domain-containing protein [Halothece sp. Uz-M2-17]